jgi:hypothetical protein
MARLYLPDAASKKTPLLFPSGLSARGSGVGRQLLGQGLNIALQPLPIRF